MNILMVCPRYYPLLGGVETIVYETAKRIAALGHGIQVLTTDRTGELPVKEFKDGVNIKRVKAYPSNRDYCIAPQIYNEIAQCRRNGYDIIHFQGWNTFVPIIGMAAAIRFNIPFAISFHSGGHPSRLRNAIRPIQQKLVGMLVRHGQPIGTSNFETDLMVNGMGISRDRFVTIRNGASTLPPSDGVQTDPRLIMSIGRLVRYKGHHRAILAMPEVLRRIPDARLLVVGSGSYEGALRALTRSLKLDERVSFVSIPPDDRQRYSDVLYTAGLVVSLSEYEANPMVVMEALSAKRRVLVSYTSGQRELADEGWCRSLPIEAEPREIADAIVTELGRQETAKLMHYTWDDSVRELLNVFHTVLVDRTKLKPAEALS